MDKAGWCRKAKSSVILSVALFVLVPLASGYVYPVKDGQYLSILPDSVATIILELPGDAGVSSEQGFVYSMSMTPDPNMTWSDFSFQSLREVSANNTASIAINFDTTGKVSGECASPYELTLVLERGDERTERVWRGGVCCSEYEDVDYVDAGELTEALSDIMEDLDDDSTSSGIEYALITVEDASKEHTMGTDARICIYKNNAGGLTGPVKIKMDSSRSASCEYLLVVVNGITSSDNYYSVSSSSKMQDDIKDLKNIKYDTNGESNTLAFYCSKDATFDSNDVKKGEMTWTVYEPESTTGDDKYKCTGGYGVIKEGTRVEIVVKEASNPSLSPTLKPEETNPVITGATIEEYVKLEGPKVSADGTTLVSMAGAQICRHMKNDFTETPVTVTLHHIEEEVSVTGGATATIKCNYIIMKNSGETDKNWKVLNPTDTTKINEEKKAVVKFFNTNNIEGININSKMELTFYCSADTTFKETEDAKIGSMTITYYACRSNADCSKTEGYVPVIDDYGEGGSCASCDFQITAKEIQIKNNDDDTNNNIEDTKAYMCRATADDTNQNNWWYGVKTTA